MNKKKLLLTTASCVLGLSMLSGCGKKEKTETTEQTYTINVAEDQLITKTDVPLVKDGMILCDLTGEWIDEKYANQRPLAVMINNLKPAMPQSGIEKADIIYEMLVEGGITRLMAIFTDYSDLSKIGPVRSARHYYDRKSIEFDALYCHVGQSIFAEADFKAYPEIHDMNGLLGVGNVMCYRDHSRKAPHNCYTSTEGILKGLEYLNMSTEKDSDYEKMFKFNTDVTELDGTAANKITTAFNSGRKPWFEYNSEDGKYYRFQYGGPQIDDQTGNQLKFENVIIQFADHSPLVDSLIDINLLGSGEGYFASNGKIIPITWNKSSDYSTTHYYNIDGSELKLNPGKTWITVFPNSQRDDIIVE